MYLNVCASFSWDKEQNYIKCERKKKKDDKLVGAREVCRFHKFQLSSFPCLLGTTTATATATATRTAKEQQNLISKTTTLHVLFTFFCTLLCRHFTTTMWKCLILHFLENLNTRQRLRFSFSDLRYSLLEFSSGKICQHLTNWTRWAKHHKVWSNANSLFLKVTFSQPLPSLLRKLPIG